MKKNPWIGMGLFLAGITLWGGTITVTQPAGGSVTMGKPCTVAWTATGVSVKVKIQLVKPDGTLVGPLSGGLQPDGSPFIWTVAAPAVAGQQYRIRVHANDGQTDGDSAVFTVVQLATPPQPVLLQLETPKGGENFILHHDTPIAWKSIAPATVGKVQLRLYRHPCCFVGVIADNMPATGTFTWKAGEYGSNSVKAGKYTIRVRSMTDPGISAANDTPFNLNALITGIPKPMKVKRIPDSLTLKPKITNWMGNKTFPGNVSPPVPLSVFSARPVCDAGTNDLARVGVEWFPYLNVRAARLQRSKLVFPLHDLLGRGAELKQATLKLKRLGCVCNGDIRVASCVFNIGVLQAPWTSFFSIAADWLNGPTGSGDDFSKDVTDAVRKWLDGTEDYRFGFLLLGDEAATSKNFACFSCFEPTLVLTWK